MIGKMTNWDAKKAFSEFCNYEFIPCIYIDEYWDYHIELINLTKTWTKFLKEFTESGFTYESFYQEYNRICEEGSKLLLNCTTAEVGSRAYEFMQTINDDTPLVKAKDLKTGMYIYVDLHNAIDESLKYIGAYNPNFNNTYDIIKSLTPYKIFHNMKRLRVSIYYYTFAKDRTSYNKLFRIMNGILLTNLHNSSNPDILEIRKHSKLLSKTPGDTLIYEYNPDISKDIIGEKYTCDGFGYHILFIDIRRVSVIGKTTNCIKYINEFGDRYAVYGSHDFAREEFWVPAIKSAFFGDLTEKDLAVGFEDQIFFHFDPSKIKNI